MRPSICLLVTWMVALDSSAKAAPVVTKKVLRPTETAVNLLRDDGWHAWAMGYQRTPGGFVCDNGNDDKALRGVSQTVILNQKAPTPIQATAWSKAESVGGGPNADYSLYLDLVYADGTPLWGQIAPFSTGTHDWQKKIVTVFPDKPVRSVAFHMLLRRHTGKAWFREPRLVEVHAPEGAELFDGMAVTRTKAYQGDLQVRDVGADSDFIAVREGRALGMRFDVTVMDGDAYKRYVLRVDSDDDADHVSTVVFSLVIEDDNLRWFVNPRTENSVEPGREYVTAKRTLAGANGRLSSYPFAAVGNAERGAGIGLDMAKPALFRVGFSAFTNGGGELYIAFDLALTRERPHAEVGFVTFDFPARAGFRGAVSQFYRLFPKYFTCRTPEMGLWMPFARISQVEGWEDFGFKFKEGNNETAWDDAHNIITFRYTEPHLWWMRMDKDAPRTLEAAIAQARRMAKQGDARAQALLNSVCQDQDGLWHGQIIVRPWCNGAVWGVNSDPGLSARPSDFSVKWNEDIKNELYGPRAKAQLDGEYVDSSEGYVTPEINFRRDHFAHASAPLTFDRESRRPCIFRGLVAWAYVHAIAADVHGMGKLMMANSTPFRLCWLAPWLDVVGQETNWNPGGRWQPMSDAELLYRRVIVGPKPYCFLMNTDFSAFSHALVEKYMQRCLAYGMFPGFFSHNASEGHYFTRPALYNRDRPLFRKYIPLCRRVAEAGWQPVTRATTGDPQVYVERWGDQLLTVFNDSQTAKRVRVTWWGGGTPAGSKEPVSGQTVTWKPTTGGAVCELSLEGESVALLDLSGAS